MDQNPAIAFINHSTVSSEADVEKIRVALQAQVDEDFAPVWHLGCRTSMAAAGAELPLDAWWLGFFDDSDQAGALGYHDYTSAGLPIGKVFVKTSGATVSVTASHELLEMLGDPTINLGAQGSDTTWFALEVGDPVEADNLAYDKGGVLVSDFITPEWYIPDSNGPWDFRGHLTAPLQVADDGYIYRYEGGKWLQRNGSNVPARKRKAPVGSRRERRARGHKNWKRSRPIR